MSLLSEMGISVVENEDQDENGIHRKQEIYQMTKGLDQMIQ